VGGGVKINDIKIDLFSFFIFVSIMCMLTTSFELAILIISKSHLPSAQGRVVIMLSVNSTKFTTLSLSVYIYRGQVRGLPRNGLYRKSMFSLQPRYVKKEGVERGGRLQFCVPGGGGVRKRGWNNTVYWSKEINF
jgi:hypothetical protein